MATTSMTPTMVADGEIVVDRIPMSYDAYLDWYDKEAGRRGEWVDGDVIPFVSTSTRHGKLVWFLILLVGCYLESNPIGEVFPPEVELRTREGAAREPDLQVILNEHADRIEEMRIRGAADVVVEIISPDSVTRDRRDKRDEYASAGIPEYWVLDPRPGHEAIDVLVLGADGRYEATMPDADGRLASRVMPGIWLDAAWLTAEAFPPAGRLGTEMGQGAVA